MRDLTKKMLRDLWKMKTQFIAVLLISFLALFIYAALEGVWYGMINYADEWMEDTNTADAWITGYGMGEGDIEKIEAIEGIASVQPVASITAEMNVDSGQAQMLLLSSDENKISMPTLISGSEYDPLGTGIWLFESFALEHNIDVGNQINIQYDNEELSLEVKGLVLSPEYLSYTGSASAVTPNYELYGYGFVSTASLEQLTGTAPAYNQIKICYDQQWDSDHGEYTALDSESIAGVRNQIEKELGSTYIGYSDREDHTGISSFEAKFMQLRSMTILFAALMIVLAVMTIQTTMKRMVEIQRTQIGTLKALGYQDWKIRLHYLSYGFWVSLIGGLLGILTAPLGSGILLAMQQQFFSAPEWEIQNSMVSLILLAGAVAICSFAALLASRKGTKAMPAITMREEPPCSHKPILLERFTGFWNLLSYEWKWTLRVAARNKVRTVVGIIGVAGSVMLLLDSFGLNDSLTYANESLYGTQFDYAAKVTIKDAATDEEKEKLMELTNGNAEWLQESVADIRTSQSRSNNVIQIYGEGYFYHFENTAGERVALPSDGVAISRQLADELNIQQNDFLQFRIAGQNDFVTVLISEIITPATPQGIFMSAELWQSMGEAFMPNALLTGDGEFLDDMRSFSFVTDAVTLEDQLEQANEVIDSIRMVIILLIAGALLLSVIILYNLGILGFAERSREYATLKVIGYRNKEIKSFIWHDNLLQLFIGLLIGIPAGYGFLGIHIGMASTATFEYVAHVSVFSLICVVAIICVVTFIINYIVSRKALNLDMVAALKSIE